MTGIDVTVMTARRVSGDLWILSVGEPFASTVHRCLVDGTRLTSDSALFLDQTGVLIEVKLVSLIEVKLESLMRSFLESILESILESVRHAETRHVRHAQTRHVRHGAIALA